MSEPPPPPPPPPSARPPVRLHPSQIRPGVFVERTGTVDVELRVVTLDPRHADPSHFIYGTMLPVVP